MAKKGYNHNGRTHGTAVPIVSIGLWRSILLIGCVFVLALILAGICVGIVSGWFPKGSRDGMIASQITQNIVAFCGTALTVSVFLSRRPVAFLGLTGKVRLITLLNLLICFIIGMPFLNETVYLNANMQLPDWMASVGEWARDLEQRAAEDTGKLLSATSVGGLITGLLVVGLLTGFSEELFFRGTVQRTLSCNGVNPHVAVWLTACFFSLLHFQFFGFLPRLLLGAFFGYLFLWSGSIWVAAIAHALNNSIVVVEQWFVNRGAEFPGVESFGVQTSGFPWVACASLAVLLLFIFVQRRKGF